MEDWVESGIKCITEQTYENLEIIIIDDGSKDGSYMKCLAEADKDRRIAVFGKTTKDRVRQEIWHSEKQRAIIYISLI